ncbi:MAG: hypothetical protein JWP94_2038 [Mucilaginibacter sp.]|nr:hypothetical protein [Mucilaginibacter sp.]
MAKYLIMIGGHKLNNVKRDVPDHSRQLYVFFTR